MYSVSWWGTPGTGIGIAEAEDEDEVSRWTAVREV